MAEQIPAEVRAARRDVSRLVTERNALLRDAARAGVVDHDELISIDARIGGLLDGILPLIDPCDASEAEPLVLLPVRLETRFATAQGATSLKVRIYPDEIHVDDLARGLTDDEALAGEAYWSSVWTDPVPEGAWSAFVSAVGDGRAEWVAHVSTPTNLGERGTIAAPAFRRGAPRAPRSTVARALPDRFVVIAIQAGQVSRAVGKAIARDLALSLIPLEGDEPVRVEDVLTVSPGAEWLVDYERAVAAGMGVTVRLAGGNTAVDRVIAIGTRASLTPAASADELEDLLAGHRYGRGLELLAQGVPTNNADAERSPYRARRSPQAPPLTPPVATPGSDTSIAADVLGVAADTLTGLLGDGSGEQAIAQKINTALWAPGWGEFLSRLDEQGVPGVTDAQRESARGLFRDHVRGRGCAPAIRVGAQPYGVLPVSSLNAWVPQVGETTAAIAGVVRGQVLRWRVAAQLNVPRIRPGRGDLDKSLLEVLGSSPVMQGLRARPVVSDDVSAAVIAALGLDHREYEAEKISVASVLGALLGASAQKALVGSLHSKDRPLPLPLASERDPLFIDALLGRPSRVLPIDSVLQALLALALDSSELDVAKASPATVLPALVDFIELEPQLKVAAAAMIARADSAPPEELHGLVTQMRDSGVTVGGTSMLRSFQPVEQVQSSLAEVALSAPVTPRARAVAASAFAGWLFAMSYVNEVRAAMKGLAGSDVKARALAVGEALDCSSHRLDAWATAIVSERRSLQSARKAATLRGGSRGLTIGAYGAVENLVPQGAATADGWIHAPSTRHAIAAGMLRSSQLSHLPASGAAGDGGPFAIDLSSRRMQAAARVIEGVRQGQQLGALVGYQIERGLAGARLARLQLSMRTIAPLVARRLHDRDGADPRAAQESLAASNVVDGVLLLKSHAPGDPALRAKLDAVPANVYLEAGDWTALTNSEWTAVTRIMREAADTIDAVADVMLSESVLQYAGGNPQRASAAMDAMSSGASPSDTIDVLEAQDSGERLSHRVLAVVGEDLPASAWNVVRPRAMVEPRLEAWAAVHLGDPANIVVAQVGNRRITLAAAGFAALDLVFATDLVALERTLRMTVAGLGDAPLAVKRDADWPARLRALGQVTGLATTLRAALAGSHALLPVDLARPGESASRQLGDAIGELTSRVTTLAASLAGAVAGLAATVSTIPADGIVADADDATALAEAIYALEPFGIALEPTPELPLDVSWVRRTWQAAEARSESARALADQMPAAATPSLALDAAQDAVSAIYGDGFLVVPVLDAAASDRFAEAVTDPVFAAPPASALRRWLRDAGTVRQQVTRLSEALLLEGALGHPRSLAVAQLSERGDAGPAPGTTHWLAGPLPAAGPWPASSVAHLVLDRVGTIAAGTSVAGLVIDGWVEDLPAQVGPKAQPDDPRPGRARTGLALRCNSASARAPQSILCAVSPNGKRWTTDMLRSVIEETLDLARVRMVTLERLIGEGLILPALYVRSSSLQGQQYFDASRLASLVQLDVLMPFVKESKS